MFGKQSLPEVSDHNVMFAGIGCVLNDPVITKLEGVDCLNEWRKLELHKHTITADPRFVDINTNDYTLRPDSPACELGFRLLDFSNVGLRGRVRTSQATARG